MDTDAKTDSCPGSPVRLMSRHFVHPYHIRIGASNSRKVKVIITIFLGQPGNFIETNCVNKEIILLGLALPCFVFLSPSCENLMLADVAPIEAVPA